MIKRFMKLMEYRSYCLSIQQLRNMGHYEKAREITEFKNKIYPSN